MLPLPITRVDPTTITNVYPGQENAERQRELQLQQWQQQQGLLRLMATPTPTPEPDIEFQDFVAGSLGTRLPIFGQNMFDHVPSTFAPLDRVQVTPDYILGPGDELVIRTWGQINVDWRAMVDRGGAIYIPKVGVFNVAGVRYEDLHDHLNAQIARIFKGYQLSVTLGSLRSIQVFVVGQVKRPGVYTISSLSSLVDALFASGGPSKRGSIRRIQLKRNGQTITTFDLYDLIVSGDKSKDAKLLPGDVIYVPPAGSLVALAGSVNTPAIFELKEHTTLAEVIGYAGGLTTTAARDRVVVERIGDSRARRTEEAIGHAGGLTTTSAGNRELVEQSGDGRVRRAEELALNPEGLARELRDGDVIRFLPIRPKFENAVTLRGNVAVPGRYPWRQGMRVHDLIPSREFLITDEYWKRQNALAVEARGGEPRRNAEQKGQAAGERDVPASRELIVTGESSIQRKQQLEQSAVEARPGEFRLSGEELKNDVKRISSEINWKYAVVQRMNPEDLTPHMLPFNLGKAIERDEQQDLLLQPNDIITIFSQHDIQVPIADRSKFVHLEGELKQAGVYQVRPGETLRQLVERVGGFTPQAYLFGAEFLRESTRVEEQQRLDEYVNGLERSLGQRSASAAYSAEISAAAARAQAEQDRNLVEKMKGLRATGRVVLELKPNAEGSAALPDLALEDGDRFLVPFRPATVSVIGSVYNNNAFIYKPGKTAGEYLRLAGGATRNGDTGHVFVIRADGSTVSRQQYNTLIARNFGSLRLMPGDTIIVPEKLDRGAAMRALREYTTILSQFGIAAAGFKTLFP